MARKLKPVTRQMLKHEERELQRSLSYQARETLHDQLRGLMQVAAERVTGGFDADPTREVEDVMERAIERQVERMTGSGAFEELMLEIEAIYDEV